MIYTLRGVVTLTSEQFFVVECGGVGYRVVTNSTTLLRIHENSEVRVFCYHHIREDQNEIFGFLETESLKLFELLNTVSGVGPKTALGVLDVDSTTNLFAAIMERRVDLITRASGIGKKTAERIVLELQNKIKLVGSKEITHAVDRNRDVEDVLVDLGYPRQHIRSVIESLSFDPMVTVEERLRFVLKQISKT